MAKKVKPQAQIKKQPEKLLVKVPAENVFLCHNGSIFVDISELAEGLSAMSDETFAYHSNLEKRDFSNWVKDVIGDEKLADELAGATSRFQATVLVAARVIILTGK